MGEIKRMLAYKAAKHGGQLVQVDRWLPSSTICRKCGQEREMPLSVRIYECDCGHVEDRDLNASRNIMREGLRLAAQSTSTAGSAGTHACGHLTSTGRKRGKPGG